MVSNLILFFMQINKVRWIFYRWKGDGWYFCMLARQVDVTEHMFMVFCVMLWHTFCWIPLKKSEGLSLKWISSRHDNVVSQSLNYNGFCLLKFFSSIEWQFLFLSMLHKSIKLALCITKFILESNTTDIDLMNCPHFSCSIFLLT